jgi:hypothetical protein
MLTLKLQLGGKAYILSRSKEANSIVRLAQFSGPMRQYTYDQRVTHFNDAYNELALIREPIQEHVKVQLSCDLSKYTDASWAYTTSFLHKPTYYTSSNPTS